jgi:hypothetical protein
LVSFLPYIKPDIIFKKSGTDIMVKESLKPLKQAIEKQEKKRKKLLDKKKKLKVTYDKDRDVYIVKMKGKKYLLKRKEPVRKLRTSWLCFALLLPPLANTPTPNTPCTRVAGSETQRG